MINKKLEEYKISLKGKRVAVLGLGISNTPLVEFLHTCGVENIECFDRSGYSALEPVINRLKYIDPVYHLGDDYLKYLKGFDIIFRTPVVRFDIPELESARMEGAVVTSEMEVFCDLCPTEIFAVTGSAGKTTTTTIIHGILQLGGYKCWLGGNIGTPLLSYIADVVPDDKVVLELSSFQLQTMRQRINISVITNISPNHLDIHKSYDEYIEAKKNIIKYQQADDRFIVNLDIDTSEMLLAESRCPVIPFTRLSHPSSDLYKNCVFSEKNEDGILNIYIMKDGNTQCIMTQSSILLPGLHNLENYLAAFAATSNYVDIGIMKKFAEEFKGVPHRLETIRVLNGVTFINDSKATGPNSAIAALLSFDKKVILIAGGKDKNLDYSELGKQILKSVKSLYLIGPTSKRIRASLEDAYDESSGGAQISSGDKIPVFEVDSYSEIIRNAYEKALPGDIILLSPASTSFDLFKNFEERGNLFRDIVNSL